MEHQVTGAPASSTSPHDQQSAHKLEARRKQNRERAAIRRAAMTQEQREQERQKNRQRARTRRSLETTEQKAARRHADRVRQRQSRHRESPSHRAQRQELDRHRRAHARKQESLHQHNSQPDPDTVTDHPGAPGATTPDSTLSHYQAHFLIQSDSNPTPVKAETLPNHPLNHHINFPIQTNDNQDRNTIQ